MQVFIGQKAFITNGKGEVLIIKRDHVDSKSGVWDFPGGRLKFGETLREALVREVKEESGINLVKISLPLSINTFFRADKREYQIIRKIYFCEGKGKVSLSNEHNYFEWISPTDYKRYEYPDVDYHATFERYMKWRTILPEWDEFLGEGMLEESIQYRKSSM